MIPMIGIAFVGAITAGWVRVSQVRQPRLPPLIEQLRLASTATVAGGQERSAQQPPTVAQAGVAPAIEPGAEPWFNPQLVLSSVALGTTCAGRLFFPPLGILTTPLMVYLVWPIYQAAWEDVAEKRTIKIDGLMAIFTTSAWLTRAYVGSALSIFTLALSDTITTQTRARSQQKLIEMFDQQPHTVWRLVDGQEVETPFDLVQAGDIVVVHAGQVMPVDGIVHGGMATVDQQRLTGEARPVDKGADDAVLAATLLVRGRLLVRVEKAGQATLAAQIAQILNQTTAHHLAVEERGLMLAEKSVLPSLLLGAIALPLRGFHSAVAVLSAMPGIDMHYAGPLALLNSLHLAAQHGILVKDGRSLELLHTVDTVIFDKTGTLTLEQPMVAACHALAAFAADDLLFYAATAEQHQSHPIAQAILAAAQARNLTLPDGDETRYEVGYGVQVRLPGGDRATGRQGEHSHPATHNSQLIRVGSERFMQQEGIIIPPELHAIQTRCAALGHSLVYVAVDEGLAGALELQPTLRPEAQAVVTALHKQGLTLYILSGDQVEPTRHLAERLGIEHYFANVLPTAKAQFITDLQAQGRKVCFVGDGINDAIALQQAHVSISLRGATTIATDTAQIVLMEQSLRQLPVLFELAHRLERNLMTSFGLSVGTGVVILTGALAFQMSVGAAVGFGAVALLGIVGNAMTPLLFTLRQQKSLPTSEDSQPNGVSYLDTHHNRPADSHHEPPAPPGGVKPAWAGI